MQRYEVQNTNGRGVEDVSVAINGRRVRRAREAMVKHDLIFLATPLCFGLAGSLTAQAPQMNTVQPDAGTAGAVLRAHGVYLGKAKVDEVYLSDHTFDMKVKVLDQKDDVIEFRIPPFAKPGRLQMVVKTTGKQPLILEQPVYITVDEPTDQHGIINSRDLPDIPVKQASAPMLPGSGANRPQSGMMTECNRSFRSKHCSRDDISTDRSSSCVLAGTRVSN
jgi:hypothetical protein